MVTMWEVIGVYRKFQSPRGDFGFLKLTVWEIIEVYRKLRVSIPSRGFWFFETPLGKDVVAAVYV